MQARNLRVLVMEKGKEKVDLSFPIHTLNIIESIMPEFVLSKLQKRNIHLETMIKEIKESNYRPQTVFEISEEIKSYKVWIE